MILAAGALHSPRLLAFSSHPKTDLLRKTVLVLNERFPHSSIQPLGFDGELIAALLPPSLPAIFLPQVALTVFGAVMGGVLA